MSHVPKWWKSSVVYQIYPASFKDSNGDGVGDIPGIIEKLDYLRDLGVDIIWVSPFFQSPQFDLGYDISDYKAVHEPYGDVSDVENLIKGCHDRGMKVIFDLVINHTSHLHQWFLDSRSSTTSPERDWYIWRPPTYVDGVRKPPCNWQAAFGGSVWEWDEETQEYYLHFFCKEQPDLNWENPIVRKALYEDAVKFWLDKGCDGFRIDTVNLYSKHLDFPDAPVVDPTTPWQPAFGQYFGNGPRLHEFIRELSKETFQQYDCVTIGEMPSTPNLSDVLAFISVDAEQLNMVIQFDLADLDHNEGRFNLMKKKWELKQFKEITVRCQRLVEPELKAWACTYLENHDQARSISRYGNDSEEHRVISGKMLATYLLTLSGTPIIYEGEEIGMINAPKSWSIEEEYQDVGTRNQWEEIKATAAQKGGDPELLRRGEEGIRLTARDHARTPMQWDDTKHAGFSTAEKTWMRAMDSYTSINAASQVNDPFSVLSYYRKLIKLRKSHPEVFIYGLFHLVDAENPSTLVYYKTSTEAEGGEGKIALVALNFSSEEQKFQMPKEVEEKQLEFVLGNGGGREGKLQPWEARVWLGGV